MPVIFGIRRKAYRLATVFAVCAFCQTPAAQAVTRVRTFFTLFFLPVLPLGSKYRTTCTMCGRSAKVTKEAADQLVTGAERQNAAPGEAPTPPARNTLPPAPASQPARPPAAPEGNPLLDWQPPNPADK